MNDEVMFYIMLAGSMAIVWLIWTWLRTGKMKQSTIDLLVDDFVSSVEDRLSGGDISKEDRLETYRRLKQLFPSRNLYPSVHWLKASIKKRRTLGVHDPVKLPDATPPKKKMRHAFDYQT